ncbi:MAG: aldo/keto reductase [Chloroflexi bacterium]|nr:aldo/keto reductase [Chloroflexota bacterium]
MKYVRLGRTGLKVSEYCMGADNFGDQTDEPTALRMMARAVEAGVNFIDTANSYVGGRSEEIVGRFLRGRRHDIVLATKCRSKAGPGLHDIGLSRKAVMKAVEDSLRRLQTDFVDLYQAHNFDPDTPIDETLRAFDDLVHQGKVRYIGCSNFAGYQLARSLWMSDKHGLARFDSVQPRYNLLYRHPELEVLPLCAEEKVGVIVYSPMAGGFLMGKHRREGPQPGTRFADIFRAHQFYRRTYWHDAAFTAVERFLEVAKRHSVTPFQLGTGWVRKNPVITALIVGARNEEQLESNLRDWELPAPPGALAEADQVADWHHATSPLIV